MWFEYAFRAARGTGRRAPTEVERALCSNILNGFLGWPEPKEMGGFEVLARDTPEEVRSVRVDTRRLMLFVIDNRIAPFWRKRFAVLALANLYVLGIGDAGALERCDRLTWLVPSLREYLRDAIAGVGAMSLGPAPYVRNRAVEEDIAAANGPVERDQADDLRGGRASPEGASQAPPTPPAAPGDRRVRPCDLRALAQYDRALELRPDLAAGNARMEDVYEVVRNEVHDGAEEGRLPDFKSWRRFVNRARHDPTAPKRSPRAGREGRNVVRRDDL